MGAHALKKKYSQLYVSPEAKEIFTMFCKARKLKPIDTLNQILIAYVQVTQKLTQREEENETHTISSS